MCLFAFQVNRAGPCFVVAPDGNTAEQKKEAVPRLRAAWAPSRLLLATHRMPRAAARTERMRNHALNGMKMYYIAAPILLAGSPPIQRAGYPKELNLVSGWSARYFDLRLSASKV